MKEYRIEVSTSHCSSGTCSVRGCHAGGNTMVSYKKMKIAGTACCNAHVVEAARELICEYVPRNVKRYKITIIRKRVVVHEDLFASNKYDNERVR